MRGIAFSGSEGGARPGARCVADWEGGGWHVETGAKSLVFSFGRGSKGYIPTKTRGKYRGRCRFAARFQSIAKQKQGRNPW